MELLGGKEEHYSPLYSLHDVGYIQQDMAAFNAHHSDIQSW